MTANFVNLAEIMLADGFMEEMHEHATLERQFLNAKTMIQQWAVIRKIYQKITPEILEEGKAGNLGNCNPYYVDWCKFMTPIEYDAWCSIRCKGLGLYPQFPVLNFFLDFANPYLKIAVEMDGKDWHNPEKDFKRDTRLLKEGWFIFRIPGRECHTKALPLWEYEDSYAEDWSEAERRELAEEYFTTTCDGVFEAVDIVFFRDGGIDHEFFDLAIKTLKKHRTVHFDIYSKIKGLARRW